MNLARLRRTSLLKVTLVAAAVLATSLLLLFGSSTVKAQEADQLLSLTISPVNTGPGHQYDPHISGDLVTYTDDRYWESYIRLHNLQSGEDTSLSGSDSTGLDYLSDVSGTNAVFTRRTATSSKVFLSDTTGSTPLRELEWTPGSVNFDPAIGGNTVAFVTLATPNPEIVVYDLNLNTSTQLTNDNLLDYVPAVSSSGDVVAWQKCEDNAAENCQIYKSMRRDGVFDTPTAITAGGGEYSFPNTSDSMIAYAGVQAGGDESDIYYQPVSGGAEKRIELPGRQDGPSISGTLIAFESGHQSSGTSDIVVYDTATEKLYRVTNTPELNELLSDVWVAPDGLVRVVWSVLEGDTYNVYAASFRLPTVDTQAPTITVPPEVREISTSQAGASVNYSGQVSASDNVDGPITPSCSPASGSIFPIGPTTVECSATDQADNQATATFSVSVVYDFGNATDGGFGSPISGSALNTLKAGATVPVKFGLGGDFGLEIFASGYPTSRPIACDPALEPIPIAGTATASTSSLRYDASADQYIYNWKTEQAWKGTCREFNLKLADGTDHPVMFEFK